MSLYFKNQTAKFIISIKQKTKFMKQTMTNSNQALLRRWLHATFGCMALILLSLSSTFGQIITIPANGGTSGNIPMGTSYYAASESIYLQSEINTAVTINRLNYSCATLSTVSNTYNNIAIYMKTTTASVFVNGSYSLTGYTLVYNGPMIWTTTGYAGVTLTTPFVYSNTAGQNLQVLIIRTDNSLHTGNIFNCANGNAVSGTAALTCRRWNTTTPAVAGSSVFAASAFRPAIQIGNMLTNDIAVTNIYTLGKLPIEYGSPTVIKANVKNTGLNAMSSINVSCSINGSNTFTDNVPILSLAPGASTVVTFTNYTPSNLSTGDIITVTATASGDQNTNNNTQTWSQDVTPNVYTYKNPALANAGGVGFNGATGDFVAKFNSHIGANYPFNMSNPKINEIKVDLTTTGQVYQLGIWDATGTNGAPGTNLWTSGNLTSAIGTSFIPVPNVNVNGDYYVGVRQIGTTNVGFAYQAEDPIRSGTFYYTSPTGGTTWNDFATSNSAFRFAIEVTVAIPVPPNCAINFFPTNAVTCTNPVLSWQGGGGAPTGYDVYFSANQADVIASAPAALVSSNQSGTTYTPGSLSSFTSYYWKIVPLNADGQATGCSVQSFMTGGLANCYCIPTYTGTLCTAGISNVVFNTISNTAACAPPAHAIYPATGSLTTTVEQNGVYNLSVTTTDAAIISAWIDYDQNGIIDTTEWAQVATASVANTPSTITLTIPGTALLGNTLMRIRSRVTANNNYGSDACTSFGSGSSQDYIITIAPPSPCSGTPFPGNTIASAATVCQGASANFSLQFPTPGTGVTYQWNNLNGPVAGATNSTYSQVITAAEEIYCDVTCGGTTSQSNLALVSIDFLNCYCASAATAVDDEEIYNVTFNGNSTDPNYSNGNGCSFAAPGPGSILSRYSNFKTLGNLATVTQGDVVPFTVAENECDGAPYYDFGTAIWIDFNHNGSFSDAGEQVFVEGATAIGPRNVNGNIIIPATALTGQTVMRIIVAEGLAGASLTPCLSYGYGETEDYLININAAIPCTGAPAPGNTVASVSSFCGAGSTTLSLSNQSSFAGYSGISYQWFNGNGAISGATNQLFTATVNASDNYYCDVTCSSGPTTTSSTPVAITVNALPAVTASSSALGLCIGSPALTLTASGATATYAWSPSAGLSATTGSSVSASPASSTTYTVLATDANGCTQSSSVAVPLYNVPTVTTTPSAASACAGDSVQFTTTTSSLSNDSLLTTLAAGNGSSGNAFDIIAASTVTITGFKMHITAGTTAEVWYKAGGYGNASLTSSAGWTQLGTAVAITPAGAGALTAIPVTSTITIPAGQTYGFVVVCNGSASYTNGTSVGTVYISNSDISITQGHGGAGMAGAFSFPNSPRVWNGQVVYEKGSLITGYAWTPAANMSNATIANPSAAAAVTTTYQVTVTDAHGCTASDTKVIIANACNTTLNLTCYIQGYWDANSNTMLPVLLNQGEISSATACDSIDVELHDANSPYGIIQSVRTVLNQNGTAACIFPAITGSYYIAVKHRNAIQTWSASAVVFNAPAVSYNFSTAATQAYGDNQHEVSTGVWALYTGDIVIDENVDLLDLGFLETDISNFAYGYATTDLNGDGNVDLLDSPILEDNISNFVFSAHP